MDYGTQSQESFDTKGEKVSQCDSLRARVGTQVHLQLHMGRIPASIFCFIGKGISYKAKKAAAHGSSPQPQPLLLKNRYLFYECFYFVVNAFCIKLILVKQLKRRS